VRLLLSAMLLWVLVPAGCCVPAPAGPLPNADGSRKTPAAYESPNRKEPGIWVDNGVIRVRARAGITWFDVFHPDDKRWYVGKNNLNMSTIVNGNQQGTEAHVVVPEIEVVREERDEIELLYKYRFENGANIDVTLFVKTGEPELRFVVHKGKGSKEIEQFVWLVTFGQGEAVQRLKWKGKLVDAAKLKTPFRGGRFQFQHIEKYDDIKALDFHFEGDETAEPDPGNPKWMTRVLGLDQHVTWSKSLRKGDKFAFEARDQPWQDTWDMPQVTPWIEGLWVIRDGFLDGDEMTFRIEDFSNSGRGGGEEKKRKGKSKRRR